MQGKVFTVVLNWNGKDMLPDCLDSLQKQSQKHQIVVVDNGSEDGSTELVEQKYPEAHLIKEAKNHGFAGGVNIGIRYALEQDAEYVALFNNDAVAEPDWLQGLLKRIQQDKKTGIVTGKLMRDDKKHFDSTGDFYTIWGIPSPRGRNRKDEGQYDKPESVFGASGGASLYRARMLEEIGLFDERFFAYMEDVDISFRARLSGWNVWYEPKAIAYHKVSSTSSRMASSFNRYHWMKNFSMTYTKNMPGWLYWKYLPLFLLQLTLYGATSTLKGGLWAYLRSIGAFIKFMPSVLVDRRKIQKRRKIAGKKIDGLLIHSRPPKIPRI